MRNSLRLWLIGVFAACGTTAAPTSALFAQEGWDVTLPRGETREIDFTTTEGTWMSVDLSPDGSWLVFDLLGHVYRLSTRGGAAEPLTQGSGIALNYHPRISPDGGAIAFISDRGGMDNLWIMNADGSDPRPVFFDLDSRAITPAWTPDGDYIVVRREPRERGGDDGESGLGIWMHHRTGGEGILLVDDPTAHWPSVSPDGRYVYYHTVEGGRNRSALVGDFQLKRVNVGTGHIIDITSGTAHSTGAGRRASGGAFAPEISPDGRWLAFARHIPDGLVSFKGHEFGPRTALWLFDLETGAEALALDPINIAVESGDKNMRVLPGYDWSSDGSSILISVGGGLGRLDVASGNVTEIPFEARVQRTISERVRQPFRITDGPFEAKFLRWHTASPSGWTLAFEALGRIWLSDLPAGKPHRLTPESFEHEQEFAPAWSPDGEWIAYTSWTDVVGGHVWKASATGGPPVQLTAEPGEYLHPVWSPDGSEIVVVKGSGATYRGRTLTHNPWWDVVRIAAAGGDEKHVTRVALPTGSGPDRVQRRAILSPSWGPDGRIFFPNITNGGTAFESVEPDGSDRTVHLMLPSADEAAPSPDGRWIAYQEANDVYVAPFPRATSSQEPPMVERRRDNLPVRRLSQTGGLFVRWRGASSLEFGNADRYFRHELTTGQTDTFDIDLGVPRPVADGRIALTGARIVTLAGEDNDEVLETATVVVNGRRIECVGECDTAGADRVIDASGKTIIPGFIDMHSHSHREHRGYRPLHDYEASIYLAYGVTTRLDNSMWAQNIFPTAELIEAGRMVGPRTFSTGDPLPFEELTSPEATAENITRLKSWGATSLKQHSHPRRDRRQWIAEAAREIGINLTAEGYDLEYNLGQAMDGYTGQEHPLSVVPLYSDVANFFGQAKTVYSNPFMFDSPTAANIEYWFAESDVWKQKMQQRWMPWRMTTFLRRRMLRPETDYSFPLIAQGQADIIAAGGNGALGGHGEHHGTSIHWEIWMAARGHGALGALRTASLGGAYFLGADEDLGTLEPGKLADLIVLNSNPLDDIRNTMDAQYVMKGGVLFEAATLDEVWPRQTPYGPYYWVDEDALQDNVKPLDSWRRP